MVTDAVDDGRVRHALLVVLRALAMASIAVVVASLLGQFGLGLVLGGAAFLGGITPPLWRHKH